MKERERKKQGDYYIMRMKFQLMEIIVNYDNNSWCMYPRMLKFSQYVTLHEQKQNVIDF